MFINKPGRIILIWGSLSPRSFLFFLILEANSHDLFFTCFLASFTSRISFSFFKYYFHPSRSFNFSIFTIPSFFNYPDFFLLCQDIKNVTSYSSSIIANPFLSSPNLSEIILQRFPYLQHWSLTKTTKIFKKWFLLLDFSLFKKICTTFV